MSRTTRSELAESCLHHYMNIKLVGKIDDLLSDSHYTSRYNESCLLGLKQELMDGIENFESYFESSLNTRE